MFWWIMLLCDVLIPLIMTVCGLLMWKCPPEEINKFVGYRTKRSMKSEETWEFAHRYCGKLWVILGLILLAASVIAPCPFYKSSQSAVGIATAVICAVQIVALVVTVIPTELALKKHFTDDGKRK